MSMVWQKDGQIIVYVPQKYRGFLTNTLTLLNADIADAGVYLLNITTQDQNVVTLSVNISIGKQMVTPKIRFLSCSFYTI